MSQSRQAHFPLLRFSGPLFFRSDLCSVHHDFFFPLSLTLSGYMTARQHYYRQNLAGQNMTGSWYDAAEATKHFGWYLIHSLWIKYQPKPGYGNPPEALNSAYKVLIRYYDYHRVTKSPKIGCCDYFSNVPNVLLVVKNYLPVTMIGLWLFFGRVPR